MWIWRIWAVTDLAALRSEQMRAVIQAEHDFLESFINQLKNLPNDSKTDYLDRMLRSKFEQGLRRVIIFSQFKDTVDHLMEYLLPQYGEKLGSYSGVGGSFWNGREWATCSKQKIQQKFTDDLDPLAILICTDAAAEGLDLQSCNTPITTIGLGTRCARAMDRPYRPYRTASKATFTLFLSGTVEETVRSMPGRTIPARIWEISNLYRWDLNGSSEMGLWLDHREQELRRPGRATTDQSVAQIDENIRIFTWTTTSLSWSWRRRTFLSLRTTGEWSGTQIE